MKTTKYNNMIEAFECDFNLALEGKKKLSKLDKAIENNNKRLLNDIDLLGELSYLLRSGKAEIHLIEEARYE